MRTTSQAANKCAIDGCDNHSEGRKYCAVHQDVTVSRSEYEAMQAKVQRYSWALWNLGVPPWSVPR